VVNLALTLAGLSLLGATLTLPGIAGVLLALGMAVHQHPYQRARPRRGAQVGRRHLGARGRVPPRLSHDCRANATTLIKMLILFAIGTGAIRGFAITISMGILISMFTAIVLVRLLISRWLRVARPKVAPDRHALARMSRGHDFPANSTPTLSPGVVVGSIPTGLTRKIRHFSRYQSQEAQPQLACPQNVRRPPKPWTGCPVLRAPSVIPAAGGLLRVILLALARRQPPKGR
jgi:hypothetical protein